MKLYQKLVLRASGYPDTSVSRCLDTPMNPLPSFLIYYVWNVMCLHPLTRGGHGGEEINAT